VAATYNVHRWAGMDGRTDVDRVIRVLMELNADVMALQEAVFDPGNGPRGIETRLSEALNMKIVSVPTCRYNGLAFGHLLLSRHEIESVKCLDLSFKQREERRALDVRVPVNPRPIRVIATHLGLSLSERRFQVMRLIEHVKAIEDEPVILMGDFNAWLPGTPWLRLIDQAFGATPRPATFPARAPLLPLDRIWARPREALTHLKVYKTAEARAASDHLPLTGRFRFEASP